MTREDIVRTIRETGLVPVIRAANAEQAQQAAEAVQREGIAVVEITMTVPGAIRVMEKVAADVGDKVLLGAGTILDPETARAAILAGAQFLVAPSLNLNVIAMAHRYSKAVLPGALTPTEVLAAWEAGADFVKVFPAGNMGGPKYIKALKGPFPQIEMVPTGGVNLETAADFLKAGACAVAVGGELVDARLIQEGRYDLIEERARQYLAAIAKARGEMPAVAA